MNFILNNLLFLLTNSENIFCAASLDRMILNSWTGLTFKQISSIIYFPDLYISSQNRVHFLSLFPEPNSGPCQNPNLTQIFCWQVWQICWQVWQYSDSLFWVLKIFWQKFFQTGNFLSEGWKIFFGQNFFEVEKIFRLKFFRF